MEQNTNLIQNVYRKNYQTQSICINSQSFTSVITLLLSITQIKVKIEAPRKD